MGMPNRSSQAQRAGADSDVACGASLVIVLPAGHRHGVRVAAR
jgi:hypothetical protein